MHMGRRTDAVANGVNMTLKVLTSLLWAAVCVGGFAAGAPIVGVVAIAYLVYLWGFGGRWLIY
jgi:hypothetical protein